MNALSCGLPRSFLARWSVVAVCLLSALARAGAAGLMDAQLTRIIKEVSLLPNQSAPRPAALNDDVRKGTGVSTGTESRAELTFSDKTITRLGAHTIFSFNEGTRNLDLGGGVILLHVPKDAGGARITTSSVTAAVTGTTLIFEFHKEAVSKIFVLEGMVRMALHARPNEWVPVNAGEMLAIEPVAEHLDSPGIFDLQSLMETSPLITDFVPLPSLSLIAREIERQTQERANGLLLGPVWVVYGSGDGVTLKDPPPLDVLDQRLNALPPGTVANGEFGRLKVITTPDPYVIDATTRIMTAPTITTNGLKSQGKIYRGSGRDGLASQYYFGSTSSFDTASGFNTEFGAIKAAAFKFNNLQLSGSPTIRIPPGGASNLTFVSLGDIHSVAAGATLAFPGISDVLFATQLDTPIVLDNTIAFSGLERLTFYARANDLTLASSIDGVQRVELFAKGTVTVNGPENVSEFISLAGQNFAGGTGHVTAHLIQIDSLGDLHFDTNQFSVGPGFGTDVRLIAAGAVDLPVGDSSVLSNATSLFVQGDALTITGGVTLNFAAGAVVKFVSGAGNLEASTITFHYPGQALEMGAVSGNINAMEIVGGDVIKSELGAINVTNLLSAKTVVAGGDITAGQVQVQAINPGVLASNTTLTAGAGGIIPLSGATTPPIGAVFNVLTVKSPNGIDFSGANFPGLSAAGGQLTLNAQMQSFDSAGVAGVNFNGAAAPNSSSPAGSGGIFTVNTFNDLSVDTDLSATSGVIGANDSPSGGGGTVNLNSSNGQVSVGSSGLPTTIKVSSADAVGQSNRRSSSRGGNINISSAASGITAINISSSAQLLALLNAAAPPGQGGKVIVTATGSTSGINVQGTLQADGGAVDIRQTNSGTVVLNGATLRGDIVKVAALGPNGALFIGKGVISADTILKLYANGSSGLIDFTDNVTLSGNSVKTIAADTVTIDNGKVVTVSGPAADVFVNFQSNGAMLPKANYTGSGGNGSTTGSFAGSGAKNPLPLSSAPLLGTPGTH